MSEIDFSHALNNPGDRLRLEPGITLGVGAQREVDGEVFVYMPMRICLSIPRDVLDTVLAGTEVWM